MRFAGVFLLMAMVTSAKAQQPILSKTQTTSVKAQQPFPMEAFEPKVSYRDNYFLTQSLRADSVHPKDTGHSVKKAVIFSAVLPGAGQVYNHIAMPKGKKKAYWKVPLIYAGLGVTGYYMIQNNSLQKSLKKEYRLRESSGFTEVFDPKWSQYDDQGILTLYDLHLNRRDLFIIAFGAVYILQVVDAAVEAHFVNFDVGEDLSVSLHPTMMSLQNPGVKISFKFH